MIKNSNNFAHLNSEETKSIETVKNNRDNDSLRQEGRLGNKNNKQILNPPNNKNSKIKPINALNPM
jgi:hypothetical protein